MKHRFNIFLKNHLSRIVIAKLSVDEKILITGGIDGKLRIWDAETFLIRKTISFHYSSILAIDIRADSKYALSGASDKITGLWDLNKLKLLSCFASTQKVIFVKFLSNSIIIIGCFDFIIKFWNIKTKRLIYKLIILSLPTSMEYSKMFKLLVYIDKKISF